MSQENSTKEDSLTQPRNPEIQNPHEARAVKLEEELDSLERKEEIARSRIDSEVIIDNAFRVAKEADRYNLDPLLTIKSVRLVESQFFSGVNQYERWGGGKIDPATRRRAMSVMKDGRAILQNNRAELLEEFADSPTDDSIWERAYRWVEAEKDMPARWPARPHRLRPTIADDIPGSELIDLAKRVRSTPAHERYAIMTETASNDKKWFDVLATFSSPQIEAAEATVIEDILGGRKVDTALDIGTGTGKSLVKLQEHASKVVGIDRNAILLHEAQAKSDSKVSLTQAAADAIPVRDASIDIASSTGITGALDSQVAAGFYHEIARVLKPGGVYIDGVYHEHQGYAGEELARIVATSKAMLADMIVDTVSGKFEIGEHQSDEERTAQLGSLGLREEVVLVDADSHGNIKSRINVITKI